MRALRDLARVVREASEGFGLAPGERLPLEQLSVPLVIPLSGDPLTVAAEAEGLRSRIARRVEEALRGDRAFRTGRVYCFQCSSSECAHARPPAPTDTFSGYTPTGKPEWKGFLALCMDRREGPIDRLYDLRPEILALVQDARELKGGLLPGFGRGSLLYNVLGQVVAGWIPADLDGRRPDSGRVALTLQVVETRASRDPRRLRLNVLGLPPERIAEEAAGAAARGRSERLRRLLGGVRRDLDRLMRRIADAEREGRSYDLEVAVGPLLVRMRTDLIQVFRGERGRTRHGEERHAAGDRPTSQALQDAEAAPPERILVDTAQDTLVVLGPRLRAHVFARDGRLVTSLVLDHREA
ncbi:MAG: hypothetical protein FJ098_13240, partial [Deltaproteobacteria bacterium]|nr:hypothetical protein [Deltaproteobacteria bacterium]